MKLLSLVASGAAHTFTDNPLQGNTLTSTLTTVILFVTAFLVILNFAFMIALRKKRFLEVLSFALAGSIELIIFAFALVLHLGILTHVPFTLPSGLPFNRAEIGTSLALAIGLFPAAYWQRTSMSQWRQRMADDAKVIKNSEGGVRIRSNAPGEWLN